MNKSAIVKSLCQQLNAQYERAIKALEGAYEAATGDDTKAESKYDTRGLEASYFAAGQAEQADKLKNALTALEAFQFPNLDIDEGEIVTILGSAAPLREQLLGKSTGDILENPALMILEVM